MYATAAPLVLAVIGIGWQAPSEELEACCRSATQQVPYNPVLYESPSADGLAFHDTPSFTITRSEARNGNFILYVEVPLPSGKTAELMSSDQGKSWSLIQPGMTAFPFGGWNAPSNPRRVYSPDATAHSDDGGRTYVHVEPVIDGREAMAFARSLFRRKILAVRVEFNGVNPRDADTIYAGIKALAQPKEKDHTKPDEIQVPGVYVSHDAGRTWRKFTDEVAGDRGALGVNPVESNIFYGIAEGNVVKKSADGGRHWEAVGQYEDLRTPMVFAVKKNSEWQYVHPGPGKLAAYQWVFDPLDKEIVYLVCPKGVYRTLDGGHSWCLLNLGFDIARGIKSMALNPLRPEEVFLASLDFGIFRSQDRGCHFENVTPPQAARQRLPAPLPPLPPSAK